MASLQHGTTFPEINQLGLDEILALTPAWGDPQLLLRVARKAGLLELLIKHLVLLEEQARSGPIEQLVAAEWRERRWGDQVEQAFIANRRRFERVTFWDLQLADKGQAMESYYQLCNGEISFAELVSRHQVEAAAGATKPQEGQPGLIRACPVYRLPKPVGKALRASQPGVPHTPVRLAEGFRLLLLEEWHPPTLNPEIRELMLQELQAAWLDRELRRRLDRITQAAVP